MESPVKLVNCDLDMLSYLEVQVKREIAVCGITFGIQGEQR
jgi:hypothetical protein